MFRALDSFQFFLRAQPCQKLTFKFVCIALCFHKGSRGEGWDSCATRYIRSLSLLSGANVSNALLISTHFLRNPQCAHATNKEQINPSSAHFHCRSVLPETLLDRACDNYILKLGTYEKVQVIFCVPSDC